jgi:hypothetical protein
MENVTTAATDANIILPLEKKSVIELFVIMTDTVSWINYFAKKILSYNYKIQRAQNFIGNMLR